MPYEPPPAERAKDLTDWAEHHGICTRDVRLMGLGDLTFELIGLERRWHGRPDHGSPNGLRLNSFLGSRIEAIKDRINDIGAVR